MKKFIKENKDFIEIAIQTGLLIAAWVAIFKT